eukprot:5269594-Prymnesium_polylepis.1
MVGQSGSTGLTFRSNLLLAVDYGRRGKAKNTRNHALGGLDANEGLSRGALRFRHLADKPFTAARGIAGGQSRTAGPITPPRRSSAEITLSGGSETHSAFRCARRYARRGSRKWRFRDGFAMIATRRA